LPESLSGGTEPEFVLRDADPDIRILKQAKAEYRLGLAKLRFTRVLIDERTTASRHRGIA
jgi:hypothetical protein